MALAVAENPRFARQNNTLGFLVRIPHPQQAFIAVCMNYHIKLTQLGILLV